MTPAHSSNPVSPGRPAASTTRSDGRLRTISSNKRRCSFYLRGALAMAGCRSRVDEPETPAFGQCEPLCPIIMPKFSINRSGFRE